MKKISRKYIIPIITILLLISVTVPNANAAITLAFYDSYLNQSHTIVINANSCPPGYSAGRTFYGNDQYINMAQFYFKTNDVGCSGILKSDLYLYPFGDEENLQLLETSSTTFQLSSLTTSYALATFNYNTSTLLDSDNRYLIVYRVNSTINGFFYEGDGATYGNRLMADNAENFVGGMPPINGITSPFAYVGYGPIYYVMTDTVQYGDPNPTPTPTATPIPQATANAQITEFTDNMINFIVPLCLLLLPAIVGAWALGKSGAAKWGFIAGLNIGAILSYLYLDAFGIWAIIIIIIVDVVLVFSSSRGGE